MNVHPRSDWSQHQIEDFLQQSVIPIRIACVSKDGFPVVASLWFYYADDALWSATHKNAFIVRQLERSPKAGFEIATNDYPYRGVRGKADASVTREDAKAVLARLIDRYLGDSNQELAAWLLGRAEDEYVIRLSPRRINAWDFSRRMEA